MRAFRPPSHSVILRSAAYVRARRRISPHFVIPTERSEWRDLVQNGEPFRMRRKYFKKNKKCFSKRLTKYIVRYILLLNI